MAQMARREGERARRAAARDKLQRLIAEIGERLEQGCADRVEARRRLIERGSAILMPDDPTGIEALFAAAGIHRPGFDRERRSLAQICRGLDLTAVANGLIWLLMERRPDNPGAWLAELISKQGPSVLARAASHSRRGPRRRDQLLRDGSLLIVTSSAAMRKGSRIEAMRNTSRFEDIAVGLQTERDRAVRVACDALVEGLSEQMDPVAIRRELEPLECLLQGIERTRDMTPRTPADYRALRRARLMLESSLRRTSEHLPEQLGEALGDEVRAVPTAVAHILKWRKAS